MTTLSCNLYFNKFWFYVEDMNRKGPRLLFHALGDFNIMFHPIMWVDNASMAFMSSQFGINIVVHKKVEMLCQTFVPFDFPNVIPLCTRKNWFHSPICKSSTCNQANLVPTQSAHHNTSSLGQVKFIAQTNGKTSLLKLITLLKTTNASSSNAISIAL